MTKNTTKELKFPLLDGSSVNVYVYENNDSDISSADQINEFCFYEGCEYEYEVDKRGYKLETEWGIKKLIRHSKVSNDGRDHGLIRPGLFVGTLSLVLIESENIRSKLSVDVKSRKLGYEDDYRSMLSDIASKCLDLTLYINSPVSIGLEHSIEGEEKTILQKYEFIESILNSKQFSSALNQIHRNPHSKIEKRKRRVSITQRVKQTSGIQKQIVSGRRRRITPKNSTLYKSGIKNVPEYVNESVSEEMLDTPENRFVKYVVGELYTFVSGIRNKVKTDVLDKRVANVCSRLERIYGDAFFTNVSNLSKIPMQSTVLQKKSGYREILKYWLMLEMSACLVWEAGEDIYHAGRRDVATLYEYWVFFQLLDVVQSVFEVENKDITTLLTASSDGVGLRLRAGKTWALNGQVCSEDKIYSVKFSYNKSYTNKSKEEISYPEPGSWTVLMRPDYSISIWPKNISESSAEKSEKILHLHFDAKYRIDNLDKYIASFEKESESENDVVEGKYKAEDILKMHTYKDAIRRSYGAFILYPGNQNRKWREVRFPIPGVGAFSLRPGDNGQGNVGLVNLLRDSIKILSGKEFKHWFSDA